MTFKNKYSNQVGFHWGGPASWWSGQRAVFSVSASEFDTLGDEMIQHSPLRAVPIDRAQEFLLSMADHLLNDNGEDVPYGLQSLAMPLHTQLVQFLRDVAERRIKGKYFSIQLCEISNRASLEHDKRWFPTPKVEEMESGELILDMLALSGRTTFKFDFLERLSLVDEFSNLPKFYWGEYKGTRETLMAFHCLKNVILSKIYANCALCSLRNFRIQTPTIQAEVAA